MKEFLSFGGLGMSGVCETGVCWVSLRKKHHLQENASKKARKVRACQRRCQPRREVVRKDSGGLKFSAVNYPDPETKRGKLLQIDGSKMKFPFGMAYFQGL